MCILVGLMVDGLKNGNGKWTICCIHDGYKMPMYLSDVSDMKFKDLLSFNCRGNMKTKCKEYYSCSCLVTSVTQNCLLCYWPHCQGLISSLVGVGIWLSSSRWGCRKSTADFDIRRVVWRLGHPVVCCTHAQCSGAHQCSSPAQCRHHGTPQGSFTHAFHMQMGLYGRQTTGGKLQRLKSIVSPIYCIFITSDRGW